MNVELTKKHTSEGIDGKWFPPWIGGRAALSLYNLGLARRNKVRLQEFGSVLDNTNKLHLITPIQLSPNQPREEIKYMQIYVHT
jgi:hypothetical protein